MIALDEAQQIIAAAIAKANEIGQPMNIAVVDAGANLTAFARMDGAWLGSIDIAINKAFTARAFNMSTDDLSKLTQPGESLFGIHATNHSRLVIFGGGIPVKHGDLVIGAVGASGGSVENDIKVAKAAVGAYQG